MCGILLINRAQNKLIIFQTLKKFVWLQAETRRKSLIMIPRYQRFKVVNSIPIKTELGPYLGYMGYYLSNGGRISFIFDV